MRVPTMASKTAKSFLGGEEGEIMVMVGELDVWVCMSIRRHSFLR